MTKKPIKAAEAVRIAKAVKKVPVLEAQRKLMHTQDHIAEARELAGKLFTALVAVQQLDTLNENAVEKLFKLADDIMETRRVCYMMALNGERRIKGEAAKRLFDKVTSAAKSGNKVEQAAALSEVRRSRIIDIDPKTRRARVPMPVTIVTIDRKTGRRVK